MRSWSGKRDGFARLDRRFLLMLGLGNAAVPYVLIAFAELHLTAPMAGILNATTPLFAAVVVAVWSHERITRGSFWGLRWALPAWRCWSAGIRDR